MDDIARLTKQNADLLAENAKLRSELEFLKMYPTLAQGIKGETIAIAALGGTLTDYLSAHDVVVERGKEIRIEVKYSSLHTPVLGKKTKRWDWSKVLGYKDKGINYHYLLLIGEKDDRYLEQYCEDASPYVFFLIHKEDVARIATQNCHIGSSIQMSSNLLKSRGHVSSQLKTYMIPFGMLAGSVI